MKRREFLGTSLVALVPGACVSTSGSSGSGPSTAAPTCRYGEDVHYDAARTFHIDVLVVEDGMRAYDAITRQGNEAGQTLYKTVGRYFGPMTVTFYLNVHPARLPPQLPYVIGNGFCMGMTPVLADEPGWSKIVVSVPGKGPGVPVVNGQVGLVLPRAPLLQLKTKEGQHVSFFPAIRLDIPTKYNAPITQGRFAGWPSTSIAKPSGTPGVTHVEQRVRNGEKGALFYFVHGRS